ncbi:hypothetical protein HOE04_03645 [archaeon]|jgi:hypothetical protein|nr:hypothetical protein [archaeon]
MVNVTTIKLRRETKRRLDRLKEHPRESYEEVLQKILFILNLSRKSPERAARRFRRLDAVVKRKGKKYSEVYSGGDDEVVKGDGVEKEVKEENDKE